MPDHAREELAIEVFIRRIRAIAACNVLDTGVRPDRLTPGVTNPDAVIVVAGREWTVEHRTLDSFRDMRADTAIFLDLTSGLAAPVAAAFPNWMLWLIFDVHSWPSLPKKDRDAFRTNLVADVLEALHVLPASLRHGQRQFDVALARTGLPLTIDRHLGGGPPLITRCAPPDQRSQLRTELVRALREKNVKRAAHVDVRSAAMLLLDSDDLSIINEESVHHEFTSAVAEVQPAFDHVFLVRTRPNPPFVYPLWTSGRLASHHAVWDFRRAQGSLEWGDEPFGDPVLDRETLLELQLADSPE